MKKILFFLTTFLFILISAECAHSQTEVYSNGNVRIVQESDSWQVLHGTNVIAHGDGTLDVGNLPPAFQDFLEYYAKKEVVKKKLSKSTTSAVIYGPLLKTQWNQTSPFNDDCPTVNGEHVVTGCSTISTAQVLNYYGYCNPINVSGANSAKHSNISSSYFTSVDGTDYEYVYSYTPDFSKISCDDFELAKFIVGVAFAQKANFGLSATSTKNSKQKAALRGVFGYDYDSCSITDLNSNSWIEKAIKKGCPVIISGGNSEGNYHSFVIDGYGFNGFEYHVNYGWGGNGDCWCSETQYPYDINIVIPRPNVRNATYLQQTPKYLVITGNGGDKKISMLQDDDNTLLYKQGEQVMLTSGTYNFFFEYSDGSKVAPYTTSSITLNNSNRKFVRTGNFVSTTATIELTNSYAVDFYHDISNGEIRLELGDVAMTISGNVTDKNENPISGAVITAANSIPQDVLMCQSNDYQNSGYRIKTTKSMSFIPTEDYLHKIELRCWRKGTPRNLTISILDGDNKCISKRTYESSSISISNSILTIEFDELIKVKSGEKYFVSMSTDDYNDNNYYAWVIDIDNNFWHKIYGVSDYYTYSDYNGKYTYPVDKYWSGNLHAFYTDKFFNDLIFNNITKNLSDKNFIEGGQTNPDNDKAISLTVVIPNKVDYAKGEDFDKTGLKVFANYEDGTKSEITDYELSGYNSKTNGEKYVTVNYDGLSARFKVFVGQSYPSYRRHINLEQEMSGGSLPSSVDLSNYLPPVKSQWWLYDDNGNQLSYNGKLGTCLAWAFGYYNRTYLRAKNLNLTKNDLESTENQFSPKDLYMAVSAGQKTWSQGLNGTETMDMLSTRGIATMKTVPYRNFEDSVYHRDNEIIEAEAEEYKITSYDQVVSGFTKSAIKSALNKGHLIIFSANVGTDFKKGYGNKNSSHTQPYANYDFSNTGRHVMTICGYDDSKGEHGAFKVVNSYGPEWCEDGFIWIDQDFFTDNYAITDSKGNALGFCNYYAYIMYASDRTVNSLTVSNDVATYYVGDTFNRSALMVTANYSDGSSTVVSDYEISGFDSQTAGVKTVTVVYKGKSKTFQITVKENDSNLHSITYIVDGEVYMSLKKIVGHGSSMIRTDDPSKVGYTFDGWFTADGTRYNFETGIVNDDITLYAHWNPIEYTITYNLNGGKLSQSNPTSYTIESFDIFLNNPTKEGYNFLGWTGTDLDDEEIIVIVEQGSTGNRQYTANWERKTNLHSVTYIVDGEIHMQLKNAVVHGSGMIMTNDPEKEGYTFDGWFTADGKRYDFSTGIVNDDVTLYAHWNIVSYSITYSLEGGTLSANNPYSYSIESDDFTLNNPTKDGYAFLGWTGTGLDGQSLSVTIKQGSVGDREYRANWEKKKQNLHSVTYIVDGEIYMQLKNMVVHGSNMILTDDPEKDGYTFDGWFTADGERYNFATGIVNDDVTLYAHWNVATYSISYNLGGGRLPNSNPSSYNIETGDFTLNNPSKENYLFTGWTGTDLSYPTKSVTITKGSIGNRVYTANWERLYTLTFIVDGEVYYSLSRISYGSNVPRTSEPKKDGYTFDEWYTADGSRFNFATGVFTDDITLYAHWNPIKYTITYDLDGGELANSNPSTYTIETEDFSLTNPTKEDYEFVGWTGSDLTTASNNVVVKKGSTGNRDYVAVWKENKAYRHPEHNYNAYITGKVLDANNNPLENAFVTSGNSIPQIMIGSTGSMTDQGYYIMDEWSLLEFTATKKFLTQVDVLLHISGDPGKISIAIANYDDYNIIWGRMFYQERITNNDWTSISIDDIVEVVPGQKYLLAFKADTYNLDEQTYYALFEDSNTEPMYKIWGNDDPVVRTDMDGDYYFPFEDNWSGTLRAFYSDKKFNTLSFSKVISSIDGMDFIENGADKTFNETLPQRHTIKYIVDGKIHMQLQNAVVHGSRMILTNDPVKDGYTFDGWYTADGEKYDFATGIVNSDVTLYAHWSIIEYSIAYILDGGELSQANPKSFNVETSDFTLNNPTKTGYTFMGWTGTGLSNTTTTVTIGKGSIGDRTYTAKWQVNRYTITFNTDGGTTLDPITTEYGKHIVQSKNPTKVGYTFAGWDYLPETMPARNLTVKAQWNINIHKLSYLVDNEPYGETDYVEFGSIINTITEPVKTGHTFSGWQNVPATMPDRDVAITGTFRVNVHTLTYMVDGKVSGEIEDIAYGTKITLRQEPTKEGYTFSGWGQSPEIMPDRDLIIRGSFEINTYKVTYMVDDIVYREADVKFGSAIPTISSPSKTGYTFVGWSPELPSTMPDYDINATAQWKPNQYTITFDTDGGSEVASVTADFGTIIKKPADPTKVGYTFDGWYPEMPSVMESDMTCKAYWKINSYTITFNTNEGSTVSSITSYYGSIISKPTNPTRKGYRFGGWSPEIPTTMPAEDVTVSAIWLEADQYTITFDTDGGNYIQSVVGYAGDQIPSITNPIREGYTFVGWDKQIPSVISSENMTITATWKVNQYTLSFDTDGGNAISSVKVDYGSKMPSVNNPTKVGHIFVGWNPDLSTLTMPANNLTVKAQWKKEQYTVTFDTDGGSYIAPIKADYGSEVSAPQRPSKEGYEFDGWSVNFPIVVTADLNITAKWRVKKYTITFDTDGGTEIVPIIQNFGTAITAPKNPTKAGYTFGGWTPQLPTKMPAQNVNVTAIWLRDNQYKITFDTDGGSSVTPGAYYFGETISVPTNPTKTGYTFVGWNPTIPTTMPAENLTVKAQWKAIEYTITFDTDGGDAIAPITAHYGEEITAPTTIPTKTGCTFDGWNYDFPFRMPANNLTIKTKWTGGLYKVQFDDFVFELPYGAAIPKISEPTKDGYKFIGWDGEVPDVMPAHDLVFKSQWKNNRYKITYYKDGMEYHHEFYCPGDIINYIPLPNSDDETQEYSQWKCDGYDNERPEKMPEKDIEARTSLVTSVSELSVSNIRIWSHEKTIYVVNAKSTIQIIDLTGRVIATIEPDNSRMEIPFYHKSGIYIVKTYGKTQKVFIE